MFRMVMMVFMTVVSLAAFTFRDHPGVQAFFVTTYAIATGDSDLLFESKTPEEAIGRMTGAVPRGARGEAAEGGAALVPRDFTQRDGRNANSWRPFAD